MGKSSLKQMKKKERCIMEKENFEIAIENSKSIKVERIEEKMDTKMLINKGDKLYFKGKAAGYREVEVISVNGDFATVKGLNMLNDTNKVRVEKLFKEPSSEYWKHEKELEKRIEIAQEKLWRFKEGNDF
jgi:translation initiation factor IF-1